MWLNSNLQLPDDGQIVMAHMPASNEPIWLAYYDGERETWYDADGRQQVVTHWQPLPEIPEVPQ